MMGLAITATPLSRYNQRNYEATPHIPYPSPVSPTYREITKVKDTKLGNLNLNYMNK
jgi:hypothetical protein